MTGPGVLPFSMAHYPLSTKHSSFSLANKQISEDEDFIFQGQNSPPLKNINTAQLLNYQKEHRGENVAVISEWENSSTLQYKSLFHSVRDISRSLLGLGVRHGDHIVVLAGNSIEYVQLFLATGSIGAIFAIINPTFTAEEVEAAVDFLDPAAVFVAERIGYRSNRVSLERIAERLADSGHGKLIVWPVSGPAQSDDDYLTWTSFRQSGLKVEDNLIDRYWGQVDPNDVLCIQFTSGTTGPRKASMLTHLNLLNNADLLGHRLNMSSKDVLCCSPPLSHCFGLVCGVLATITHGGTVIIPSDVFNPDASLRAIREHQCTVIHAVPTMFQAMLDFAAAKGYTNSLRLRTGIIAGSSLSETLLRRLQAELGLDGLAYAFGMTELSAVSFMTTPAVTSLLDDRSSVGTLLPHTSAKVVDGDLKALPPGVRGELLVSGYLVFKGYYQNPEKTNEALVFDSQGRRWLRTGDIVTLSSSGACTVVGRLKDMIKKGGENIAPRDVEQVLELHPDILTAAVVGIPDVRWGETVAAFIDRRVGSEIGSKDVRIWLRGRLAAFKIPEHIFLTGDGIGVPDQLPVNSSGKILKQELSSIADRLKNATEL